MRCKPLRSAFQSLSVWYVVTRLVKLRCKANPDYNIHLVFSTEISLHCSNARQRLCIGLKADHCGWLRIQLLILLVVIFFIQRGEIYSQDFFLSFIYYPRQCSHCLLFPSSQSHRHTPSLARIIYTLHNQRHLRNTTAHHLIQPPLNILPFLTSKRNGVYTVIL